MSGIRKTPFLWSTSSAPGVVGPLAASATILARTREAFSRVIWFSRAAGRDRLAGDDAELRRADRHRVGVHDPGHRLGVGVDVRGGDVALGADDDADLGGVAPRHVLELAERHLLRVADDASLAAAVRD